MTRTAYSCSPSHASKGLEFPHVYLLGLEEDLLPHRNAIEMGTVEERSAAWPTWVLPGRGARSRSRLPASAKPTVS